MRGRPASERSERLAVRLPDSVAAPAGVALVVRDSSTAAVR